MKPKVFLAALTFLLIQGNALGQCVREEQLSNGMLEAFFSQPEQTFNEGLREVLKLAAERAVRSASSGAFERDIRIHISPPGNFMSLKQITGITDYSLEIKRLELSLNKAAESASKEFLPSLLDEIERVKFRDPSNIVISGDSSATGCFSLRRRDRLVTIIRHYVKRELESRGAFDSCRRIKGNPFLSRFVEGESCDFTGYVSERAVDGILKLMADEERKIRKSPEMWKNKLIRDTIGTAYYLDF